MSELIRTAQHGHGPATEFGRLMHGAKYRAPEETFDDYCVRFARAVTSTQAEFRRLLKYLRAQIILPAGRQQLAVGRPYMTTAFNCLSGDVPILTREFGAVAIKKVAGKRVTLLDGAGNWVKCRVNDLGRRKTVEVRLSDGRSTIAVRSTEDHEWVTPSGAKVTTASFGERRVLRGALHAVARLRPSRVIVYPDAYRRGVVHGLFYGDGTKTDGDAFHLRVCSHRDSIEPWLSDFGCTYPPSFKGGAPLYRIPKARAWCDLKKLPADPGKDLDYLRGFLRGWLAADGHAAKRTGSVTLCCGPSEHAWLKVWAPLVGWDVLNGSALKAETKLCGKRKKVSLNVHIRKSSMGADDFLIDAHADNWGAAMPSESPWVVRGKPSAPKVERVYCPAVPTTRSFALAFGAHSGNCFVGETIPDSTEGIFAAVANGAITLRSGGGDGWDFSTIRPEGEPVRGLGHGARASGPISFMEVWHQMCHTIMSAGERRGAMMGVLRVDHPDVLKFVKAKTTAGILTNFNVSVGVTDAFMEALYSGGFYELRFGDRSYGKMRAEDVWAVMMETNWDWAEPGVLFVDRINQLNPLRYCETIAATNPCGEQPLPPHGACLLGSINLFKLLVPAHEANGLELARQDGKQMVRYDLDWDTLDDAVEASVRAYDSVIDSTTFPLEAQRVEALSKRRMGVGITGTANAFEVMGHPYASAGYWELQDRVEARVRDKAYETSVALAVEKGPFPLFDAEKYCAGSFFNTLPDDLQIDIRRHGLRNGLLTSIAPTGTISMAADNVSSGIEPVFAHEADRTIMLPDGTRTIRVRDAAFEFYGVKGRTAKEVSPEEHVDALCRAQRFVDSSISKTVNVTGQVGGEGPGTTFSDFKQLYLRAWEGGAKGCTTFNENGKRMGILRRVEADDPAPVKAGAACVVDPSTGVRTCDE